MVALSQPAFAKVCLVTSRVSNKKFNVVKVFRSSHDLTCFKSPLRTTIPFQAKWGSLMNSPHQLNLFPGFGAICTRLLDIIA